MNFEVIEGVRKVAGDFDRPMVLFLLEGPGAPLARPVLEPLELVDARAVLFEGSLLEAVVPDDLSCRIVRETFFEFEVSDAHRHAAINYLFQRLEASEPPSMGGLSERVMSWLPKHLDEAINLDAAIYV